MLIANKKLKTRVCMVSVAFCCGKQLRFPCDSVYKLRILKKIVDFERISWVVSQ